MHESTTKHSSRYLALLSLAALGIVYGDIGTSPLYALKECFGGHYGIAASRENVLGILSLIVWALMLIISLKYLVFVMRADNRGEGGILALAALLLGRETSSKRRQILIALGLFGAALLYGDGIITPAISVLSAVEGLEEVTPVFKPFVVPITVAILVGLFVMQKFGTARVGRVFGPIVLVWFITLGTLGILHIKDEPSVLGAVNPLHAVEFFLRNGIHAFMVLGSVFLVVTGGEALYADMGHFGRTPIRIAWFAVALPGLVLNYMGQGALLLAAPGDDLPGHPFFSLAPRWALLPLVILATMATVIASQAVISGAYSLTRQAVQLGFTPRVRIDHTSEREIGQIYIPSINWALMIATVLLVVSFRSASNLAAAYGVAVTSTMVITTLLFYVVARERWGWSLLHVLPIVIFFLIIDLAFFGANILKLPQGGWVPLAIGLLVWVLMDTWKKGRAILAQRMGERSMPMDLFLADVARHPERRVPGTAVFMTGNPAGVPPALLHNVKHNHVVHKTVVFLTVTTDEVPHVPQKDRVDISEMGEGFHRVMAKYGFMDNPDIVEIQSAMAEKQLKLEPMSTSYYLGRDTLLTTNRPGLSRWRKMLFNVMSRNATPASAFFGLPPNRVVELGAQIEL